MPSTSSQSTAEYPASLDQATILASNTAADSDSDNLAKNHTWYLNDGTDGSIQFQWQQSFTPSRLLLRNADEDGDGATKTFFLTSFDTGAIANLSYTSPAMSQQDYCEATCPLQQGSLWQEYDWVDASSITGFVIHITGWYYNSGGLSGIQIYQDNEELSKPVKASGTPSATNQMASTMGSTNATPTDTNTSSDESAATHKDGGGLSGGAIAGLIAAIVVLSIVASVYFVRTWYKKRRKRTAPENQDNRFEKPELDNNQMQVNELDRNAELRNEARGARTNEMWELPGTEKPVELSSTRTHSELPG